MRLNVHKSQVSNILFPNRWQAFGNVYWIYQNDKMPMDRSTLRQKLKFFSQINCLYNSMYVVLSTDLSIQNDKPSASEVLNILLPLIYDFSLPQSGTVEYFWVKLVHLAPSFSNVTGQL